MAATGGVEGLFAGPIDADRTRALLDHDTALVEYFLAGDELIAFVVRPDDVRCIRGLASPAELQEHVELTRFQIERPLAYGRDEANTTLVQDAQRELRELHAILFAPLLDAVGQARRLLVVPHGVLHGVPFHALYDGQRYLVEDREVLYSPSASLLSHLPPLPAGPAGRGSVIFGVADEAAPRIDQEVQAAAACLPAARVYTGAEATWQRLQDEATSADVLHIACHGWFSQRRPLASGVKLGDRWMTVRDVYGLRLEGAVVVLSGCETGRSATGGADEQVGLVRGFFAAGASAVLMTLWPLHDETAGILMASVYEFWQNAGPDRSRGLAGALRAAERRLMKENPHPFFWAPFILVGRP
jgi:CHAT domain-containing protein